IVNATEVGTNAKGERVFHARLDATMGGKPVFSREVWASVSPEAEKVPGAGYLYMEKPADLVATETKAGSPATTTKTMVAEPPGAPTTKGPAVTPKTPEPKAPEPKAPEPPFDHQAHAYEKLPPAKAP